MRYFLIDITKRPALCLNAILCSYSTRSIINKIDAVYIITINVTGMTNNYMKNCIYFNNLYMCHRAQRIRQEESMNSNEKYAYVTTLSMTEKGLHFTLGL